MPQSDIITVTIQPPGDAAPITVSIPLSPELVQAKADADALAKVTQLFFGPLEVVVVRTIGHGSAKASTIGSRLNMADASGQANTKLRGVLAGLIDRGILDNEGEGEGYHLTPMAIEAFATLGIDIIEDNKPE